MLNITRHDLVYRSVASMIMGSMHKPKSSRKLSALESEYALLPSRNLTTRPSPSAKDLWQSKQKRAPDPPTINVSKLLYKKSNKQAIARKISAPKLLVLKLGCSLETHHGCFFNCV